MPKPGYKSITIREEVYDHLSRFAKTTHRSIPQSIDYLIDECRDIIDTALLPKAVTA